jgi:hypothetical protein
VSRCDFVVVNTSMVGVVAVSFMSTVYSWEMCFQDN